jgi:carboxypeptidase D
MIVDGTIGAFDTTQQQTVAFPFIQAHQKVLGFDDDFIDQMEELHTSCGHKALVDKHLKFPPPGPQPPSVRSRTRVNCDIFSQAQYKVGRSNPCFDIYQINTKCPKKISPMKPNKQQPAYFNRKDVKEALHAPPTAKWALCNSRVFAGIPGSGPQRRGDLSLDPIQSVLPQVIEATNRVLVTNGDYDMIIITNGTLLALQNMTWNGLLGFQKPPVTQINIPNLPTAGIQHFERGLMWSEAYRTGHMGPESAPELSYRHLEWLLGSRETL